MKKAARTDVLLFSTGQTAFWANLLFHFLFPSNRKGPMVVHLYEVCTFAIGQEKRIAVYGLFNPDALEIGGLGGTEGKEVRKDNQDEREGAPE